MRRGLSILLALLFGVGPLGAALPGGNEASLPACCRRQGTHHCAMAGRMASAETGKTAISAPSTCPRYPGLAIALLMPAHALAAIRYEFAIRNTVAPAALPPRLPSLSDVSDPCAGRGPPQLRLL